jgi:chromosome segregation ATPase
MDAILNDLNSAYVKLKELLSVEEKKKSELEQLVSDAKIKASKLSDRENAIAVKEAKYKEFDAVQVMRDGVSADRQALNAEKKIVNDTSANLQAKLAEVALRQSDLDTRIAIFKQKNANCDAMKSQLEKDRAEMKQSIIAELQKGLK